MSVFEIRVKYLFKTTLEGISRRLSKSYIFWTINEMARRHPKNLQVTHGFKKKL